MHKSIKYFWGLAFLLSACGEASEVASGEQTVKEHVLMDAPTPARAYAPPLEEAEVQEQADKIVSEAPGPPQAPVEQSANVAPASSRKLIYHADMRVKVASLLRANAGLDSLTQRHEAYISDASETRSDGQWEHRATIRVSPARFQSLLGSLRGLGTLESATLKTDDVTAEHADVTARLRTKRAVEQRYIALLGQARKISDVLEIEEKIGEMREQIEATESRLKTLNDEVGYSTINLAYYQSIALSTPEAPVLSFGSRFVQSFYAGWELLTSLLLALVAAWPLLLLGGFTTLFVMRWRRRHAHRNSMG